RALRMRPLYTALVLAGRHPMLRDLLQFCVVSIGSDISPSLGVGLESTNRNVVLITCRCIGAMGLTEFAPRIEALLARGDVVLTSAAVEALARLQSNGSISAIAKLLPDVPEGVREAACAALSIMDAEAVT